MFVLAGVLAIRLLDAQAHAVVTRSSLTGQTITSGCATPVELQFSSNIELPLSKAFLVSEGDIEENIPMAAGHNPGLVTIQLPSLDPGDYALRYKVFGADGHLTEDIIHFKVMQAGE